MAAAVQKTPMKRVLAETTNTRRNIQPTPHSAKKLKVNGSFTYGNTPKKGPNGALGSSQPKSQFEEEVLEKLTQNISSLKHNNKEKDQQWARPELVDFDPAEDALVFQQIEVEEGTLHGGRKTLQLFGVTEVIDATAPRVGTRD
jgi:DNA polymerase delta subunit 1